MDYKPRSNYNNKSSLTYKKNRCFWFNSEFNEDFIINNGKIYEIIFKVPPFQIYKNNNMKVITYIRGSQNSRPIIIKMKEPFLSYQTIFNSDNEAHPVIYINHTGVESMTSITPNYSLIPQQIPRFIFRFDDNFNKLDFTSYFTSITNGSLFQVAGGGNDDKYIIFNSSGSFVLDKSLTCDILVVGGGGGGSAGGGGGGGFLYRTNQTLNSGTYTITVGAGGAGATLNSSSSGPRGSDGNDSSIVLNGVDIARAYKGGGGAGNRNLATAPTGTYGSTGGNGHDSGQTANTFPAGTLVGGNIGGISTFGNGGGGFQSAGGGGGAGGVGQVGIDGDIYDLNNGARGGNGGIGLQCNITGANIYYAGGGAGGTNMNKSTTTQTTPPTGGLGGGGNGSLINNQAGTNGQANTGGGGGGSDWECTTPSGSGGSGVVIIRFRETRQEGLTPDETIITSTNNSIIIPVNSKYNINYGDYFNIPKGSYQAVFSDGSITFNSITDKSYPILKDANNNNINPFIWYKFDDGDLKVDSSGNNYTLTASATPPTVDTTNFVKGNGSAKFESPNASHFIIPSTISWYNINTTTGLSFSFWINLNSTTSTWGRIIDFGETNVSYIGIAKSATTTNLRFFIKSGGNEDNYDTTGINYFNNNWYHIVWTISTTGIWNIYSNNNLLLTNSSKRVVNNSTATALANYIARSGNSAEITNSLVGNLDDFRIYDRTLTQTQVSELYNGRLSIYNPPEFILGVEIKDA